MVDELKILADDIVKTIERENDFEDKRRNGGFIESFKVKDIKEIFL